MSPSHDDPHSGRPSSSQRPNGVDDRKPAAAPAEALNSIELGAKASFGPAGGIAPDSGTDPAGHSGSRSHAARSTRASKAKAARAEAPTPPHLMKRWEPLPDFVQERFIRVGNNFFFPDGAEAFTDHGDKITTRSQNTVVIQSMVAIAQARAQGAVTVSGTEFFRKEAWFAAKLAGLEVKGFEPTALEHERLVRALARREAAAKEEAAPAANTLENSKNAKSRSSDSNSTARSFREGELIAGRLVDHGPATYQHQPNQPMSYYVRLETERGEREIWGVDLERAFRQSLSTPGVGDEVGLRAVGRDPVTLHRERRDTDGREAGREEVQAHRNQWIVERKDFLDRRAKMADLLRDPSVPAAEATRRFPELTGSYLQLQMGEALAEDQYPHKAHRKQFVDHLRDYLAKTVEYGRPLEPVPLREHADKMSERVQDRDYAPSR